MGDRRHEAFGIGPSYASRSMGSSNDKWLREHMLEALKAKGFSADDLERARENIRDGRTKREAGEEDAAASHIASAQRYPTATPISLSGVRALFAPHEARFHELEAAREHAGEIEGVLAPEVFTLPSAQVVEGDLVLDDFVLEPKGSNLFVRGDLRVKGILRQEFKAGGLVVCGKLSARHVVTTGPILCLGDLNVSGILYGDCTNYSTDVLGRASVGTLIAVKEHLFTFWGPRSVGGYIDVQGSTPNLHRYGPPETRALRPEVEGLSDDDADSDVDVGAVLATLRQHDTLFAAP